MKTVWKDKFIIDVYNLAKTGMSEPQMAKTIGIGVQTFNIWEIKKKQFKMALEAGRNEYKNANGSVITFSQYVYKRLPKNLRILWRKLNKLDKRSSGFEKIQALLDNQGKNIRQHLFIYAWTASNFSVSTALKKVCISRSTFQIWKRDPEFAALIDEINWHKKNFFEDSLLRLVKSGDTPATIFVNKTFNRDRGYNEKFEVDMKLDVNATVINIDKLDLSVAQKKEILESIRKQKKEQASQKTE